MLFALLAGALLILVLTACSGDSDSGSDNEAGIPATGSDEQQIENLIRTFSDRTTKLDADGSFELLCASLRQRSDLDQIRQNMEGFKNIGDAAPRVSNLTFSTINAAGDSGEARYSYTQDFRGQTTTVQEGVKVAREGGRWCIKDQLLVAN